jgi:hypothetical protein
MNKRLNKLFNQYEGNLLNYFAGMTPEQSKKFNKKIKDKPIKRIELDIEPDGTTKILDVLSSEELKKKEEVKK